MGRWRWTGVTAFLDSWVIIKDVLLTGAGLTLIMVEVFAVTEPSEIVIITGLAMSGIGASFHVGAILGGFIGRSSSSPSSPSGPSQHSTSQESSGEHK